MKYKTHSHKSSEIILNDPQHKLFYDEVIEVIDAISDEDLIKHHESNPNCGIKKSLAPTINAVLKERFVQKGWAAESPIFQGEDYTRDKVWRLDFAKGTISIEVAFNHGEAIPWNLLKPVLASSVNNVKKAVDTEVGIYITCTKALKSAGAFDNAVGEYEKVLRYLIPLSTVLPVPLLIIGLEAPETFYLKSKYPNKPDDWGRIIRTDTQTKRKRRCAIS